MLDTHAGRSRPVASSSPSGWVRDLQRILAGSFVSMVGGPHIYHRIPGVLVYMSAGDLVDRRDPRRTINCVRVGVSPIIVIVCPGDRKTGYFLLIAVVVADETLEVFSTLADQRCVRDLVPRDRVSAAQAQHRDQGARRRAVGRPLGAFLFGLAPICHSW